MAADLVGHQVAVIVAPGGAPAAVAAKSVTTSIPIVFEMGADPIVSRGRLDLEASDAPFLDITTVQVT